MGALFPKRTVGEIVWKGRKIWCITRYDDLDLIKPKPKIFAWRTKDLCTDSYVTLILKLVKTHHEKDPATCPWGTHTEYGKPCGAPIHLVEDRGPYMDRRGPEARKGLDTQILRMRTRTQTTIPHRPRKIQNHRHHLKTDSHIILES